MIDEVNQILRDLIQSRIAAVAGPSQVAFEPPNEEWRQNLVTTAEERVNLYLYQMAENLPLRTNERPRTYENGWMRESRPLARLDCRYLITAWSPMQYTPPSIEPTRDEHVLLYRVVDLLMRHQPLYAPQVYKPGLPIPSSRSLLSVPAAIRDSELPVAVVLPEGNHDRGDFWSTMKLPWRPAPELVVTVPLLLNQDDIESPLVTTLGQELVPMETTLTIGGHVRTASSEAVPGAWVQITGVDPPELLPVNRRLVTQSDGRFVFERLRLGRYHLRAVAAGLGDIGRDIDLPSPSGEYDLQFP